MAYTIYTPSLLKPNNTSLDMSVEQVFTAQVNASGGKYTHYQIIIKKVSDNSTVYDSTKLELSPYLYDKQILSHTISGGTISNTGTDAYKYTIQVWNGSETVTTGETLFYAHTTPLVELIIPATVTSKTLTVTATYTQTENIPLKKFKYIWYRYDNSIIEDTGWSFSGNFTHTFDGLSNDTTYSIECFIENQYGVITSSGKQSFNVEYIQPSLYIIPTTTVMDDTASILVDWSQSITQVIGVVTGDYEYVEDFMVEGNYGLKLNNGSKIDFEVFIPEDFTLIIVYNPDGFTSGVMISLDDGDYIVGYNSGRFYFNNNGIECYGIKRTLPSTPFLIAIRSQDVYIITDDYIEWLKV